MSLFFSSLLFEEKERLGMVSGENLFKDGSDVGEDSEVVGGRCASDDLRFLVGDMARKPGLKEPPLREKRLKELLCRR